MCRTKNQPVTSGFRAGAWVPIRSIFISTSVVFIFQPVHQEGFYYFPQGWIGMGGSQINRWHLTSHAPPLFWMLTVITSSLNTPSAGTTIHFFQAIVRLKGWGFLLLLLFQERRWAVLLVDPGFKNWGRSPPCCLTSPKITTRTDVSCAHPQ